ncbi:MAG: glycosyltransferase [Sphingobacteriaceae bacterium]
MFAEYFIQSLFTLLLLSLILQLYFTLFVHVKLARYPEKKSSKKSKHPISVIIYSRNQAQSLIDNLPAFMEQDYLYFEVIVINDSSWDHTEDVLREFSSRYYRLKVVTVPEHDRFRKNKKFAITMGIKAAQNEHLIFSDAGCIPSSKKWINEIQSSFNADTELILGHTVYQRAAGMLNRFIRFENFINALNYLSFALKGKAYRGTGRNMAYLKSIFFRGKGFAAHMHLPFGDDDLFVNQHAGRDNVNVVIRPSAQVLSNTDTGIKPYLKEKVSQMQTVSHLNPAKRWNLNAQMASGILFYSSMIVLFIMQFDWRILLAIYSVRLIAQFVVYYKIFKRLSYPDLKWWLPILDFIYYIYVLALSIATLFKIRTKWK